MPELSHDRWCQKVLSRHIDLETFRFVSGEHLEDCPVFCNAQSTGIVVKIAATMMLHRSNMPIYSH